MFCFVWETDSHYIGLAGLKLTATPWLLFPKLWDQRYIPLYFASYYILNNQVRKNSVNIEKNYFRNQYNVLIYDA